MKINQKINNWLNLNGDLVALLLLLGVASLLRFWQLWDVPFMHDEFSALFRTRFDSFNELITKGVMQNDSHPAGVQVFLYYWVKLFGFNAFWIKLPFVLLGIASVGLIVAIGKQWFNSTTALIVGALAACLQFFVFYSQLARPYSVGLFFILLSVFWWSKILFSAQALKWQYAVYLGIAFVLAALTHYFSMVLAGFIFVSGLFFIKKSNWKVYLSAGFMAFILYLPHLPVFLYQINEGGIGDWLGAPKSDFLIDFFAYLFHFSWFFIFTLFGFFFFLMKGASFQKSQNYLTLIGFAWFAISFLLAYFYSIWRTPILQFSTLYFSIPFFLLALFSFIKPQRPLVNLFLVAIVLVFGSSTLILDRQYYNLMYQQGYDQIANEMDKNRRELGENIAFAAVGGSTEMFSFYLDKKNMKDVQLNNYRDPKTELIHFLENTNADYFGIAWTDYAPFEWIELVRSKYGKPLKRLSWFNSEYFLFKRTENTTDTTLFPGERFLLLNNLPENGMIFSKENTYGLLWEAKCDSLIQQGDDMIVSRITGKASDTLKGLKLVLEFKSENATEPLYWMSGILDGEVMPGESFALSAAFRFDSGPITTRTSLIRTYLWNASGESFIINNQCIYVRPHDPRLLGLYAPLN